ncbi:MAG: hypothetical protein JSV03_13440, partial [Planctomycetota bacterium]
MINTEYTDVCMKFSKTGQKVPEFPFNLIVTLLVWCVFLAFSSTQVAAQVGSWTTGSITTNGDTNNFVSVTTNSSGNFFGVWRPESGDVGFIEIGSWNGSSWTKVSSFSPSDSTLFERLSDDVSLAMDGSGNYHVAFKASRGDNTAGPRGVFYAKYDGSAWTFEEVQTSSDSSGWKNYDDPLIDVDSSGNPHMIYQFSDVRANPRVQYLRYAAGPSTWSISNVDTLSGGDEIDNGGFVLDSSGKAHVSYMKENADSWDADLMYATNASGSFVSTPLVEMVDNNDPAGPSVDDTDIELDSSGKVHISYSHGEYGSYSVRYLTNVSGSFGSPVEVVGAGDHGNPNVIGINGAANLKVIVYRDSDSDPSSVRAATKVDSGAWQDELVWYNSGDDFGTGSYLDAVMNNSGSIMILFHRNSDDTGDDRRVMFAFGNLSGSSCTPTTEICDNSLDDDCDGNTDCADSDCDCVVVCDTTAPTITQCAADKTLNADINCQASVPDLVSEVTADDNCDPTVTITQNPASGTLIGLGDTDVTIT